MGAGNRSVNTSLLKQLFSFPEKVNEYAARIVAGIVLLLVSAYLYTENVYILVYLTYGFWARVLTGPSLSPIALLTTRIIIPLTGYPEKYCPGPPKRFAQGIGALFTTSALVFISYGFLAESRMLLGVLLFFAGLESGFGFCAGCWMFKKLMAIGLIPEKTCEKCLDLDLQLSKS